MTGGWDLPPAGAANRTNIARNMVVGTHQRARPFQKKLNVAGPMIRTNMARAGARALGVGGATDYYVAKLKEDPQNAASHKNLAALLMGQGRVKQAVRHYEAALKFDTRNAALSNDMGVALIALGKDDRAREFFSQALDLSPGREYHAAHTNLAALFARKSDWRHALYHCQEALRLKPDDAAAERNIARILDKLGRTTEALYANQKALRMSTDGQASITHQRAAVQAIALGYNDKAHKHQDAARRFGGRHYHFNLFHADDRVQGRADFERILSDSELQKRTADHGHML